MRTLARAWLLAALVPAPSLAQEPAPAPAPLTVSVEELVLAYYRPLHCEAVELGPVARDLFGRQFWVREHGGMGQSPPVENMRLLGDQILVYDLRPNTERIIAGLKEVDARAGASAEGGLDVQEAEYRPRFVQMETIDQLLRPSGHEVVLLGRPTRNYVLVKERGVVLLRDTPERLAAMRATLAAIDVPPPQVRLRLQLLEQIPVNREGEELPEPLARALDALVPNSRFQRVGTAVLESAVLPDTVLRARLGVNELELVVRAWDAETGALSTDSCALYSRREGESHQLFQTSVVLRSGEQTILAASGGFTDFLVVELEPLR